MKRKIFRVLFALMLVLSLTLVTAVPAGATTVGASTAPTANVVPEATNELVMDFTISDGGDSLVAGTAPSAGTATVDGEDTDWSIDSYDKTNADAWDVGNDLLAIDDDADSKYTAQADMLLDADADATTGSGTVDVTAGDEILGLETVSLGAGVALPGGDAGVHYYDADTSGTWSSGDDIVIDPNHGATTSLTADLSGSDDDDGDTVMDDDIVIYDGGNGVDVTDGATLSQFVAGDNAGFADNEITDNSGYDYVASTNGEDIIIDYHDGGTYSAAADTFVAGAVPADGTAYTSDNAFDADWGMDSYDAAGGGVWNSGADAIIIDADTNDAYLDQLNAITLKNTGTAVDTTDISAVKVWAEDGTTAGFQSGEDTLLGPAAWDTTNSWDLSALTTDILAAGQRVYVTVDLAAGATLGNTIIMQVPPLDDTVAANGAYDAGEEGLFFASTDDTGDITNANIQTIGAGAAAKFTLNAPADITAGGRAAYTVTLRDASDNPVTSGTQTVYLYTDSTGADAAFYDAATAGNIITSVTIADGASTADFWYYDRQTGSWTITASDETPLDDPDTGLTNATDTLTVKRTGGGGGWTPPAPSDVDTNLFGSVSTFEISASGEVQETITATSADGNLTLTIPKDTVALDEDGNPLSTLDVDVDVTPPTPPAGDNIIGLPYDFGPSGATFNPPITLEFTYDPAEVPAGAAEEDLVIAYYDEAVGRWVKCECTCDPDTHCITASVSHFTTFAIIARTPEEAPPEAPPAEAPPPEAPPPEAPPEAAPPAAPPPGVNWAMVGPIIGVAVFLAIFLPIRLRRRSE